MVPLNEEQTRAVEHPLDQPACLIAGAGSGKTRVLTERVRWLIHKGGVPYFKILCLTFTNKAAGEMEARLGTVEGVPSDIFTPHVTTIHSLGISLIRESPHAFGLRGKVSVLDDYNQEALLKNIIKQEQEKEGKKPGEDEIESSDHTDLEDLDSVEQATELKDINAYQLKQKISFHRAQGVGFAADYTEEYHEGVALQAHDGLNALSENELHVWQIYEARKRMDNVVDFDDMIWLCVKRGRENPGWRKNLGTRFDHVLMDEAQDTNVPQWEFVQMFVAEGNLNFYVVGDLSQSIYGFQGAKPRLLKEYSEGWRGVVPAMYKIERNHRSVPEVVRLANAIQRKMTETVPIQMQSWRGMQGHKGLAKLMQATLPSDIAEVIAREIYVGAHRTDPPIPFKENAILCRTRKQFRDIEGELLKYRIPYVIVGDRGLLGTEEVRDVLAYLRLAVNGKDSTAFMRVAGMVKGVGRATLRRIMENAERDGTDLITASWGVDALRRFAAIMEDVKAESEDAVKALAVVLDVAGYLDHLRYKYRGKQNKIDDKMENLGRLAALVRTIAAENEAKVAKTEEVVFRLTMEKQEGNEQGQVMVSTIHGAKGKEWHRVYVFSVVEGYLPHKLSTRSPEEIEEERRLWYVAVTRAKDILVITVPNKIKRQQNREPENARPSRFLYEVGILKHPSLPALAAK